MALDVAQPFLNLRRGNSPAIQLVLDKAVLVLNINSRSDDFVHFKRLNLFFGCITRHQNSDKNFKMLDMTKDKTTGNLEMGDDTIMQVNSINHYQKIATSDNAMQFLAKYLQSSDVKFLLKQITLGCFIVFYKLSWKNLEEVTRFVQLMVYFSDSLYNHGTLVYNAALDDALKFWKVSVDYDPNYIWTFGYKFKENFSEPAFFNHFDNSILDDEKKLLVDWYRFSNHQSAEMFLEAAQYLFNARADVPLLKVPEIVSRIENRSKIIEYASDFQSLLHNGIVKNPELSTSTDKTLVLNYKKKKTPRSSVEKEIFQLLLLPIKQRSAAIWLEKYKLFKAEKGRNQVRKFFERVTTLNQQYQADAPKEEVPFLRFLYTRVLLVDDH